MYRLLRAENLALQPEEREGGTNVEKKLNFMEFDFCLSKTINKKKQDQIAAFDI